MGIRTLLVLLLNKISALFSFKATSRKVFQCEQFSKGKGQGKGIYGYLGFGKM